MPFRGKVEAWYSEQFSSVCFVLISLMAWVPFFPESDLIWRVFKSLPAPPDNLRDELNFPY